MLPLEYHFHYRSPLTHQNPRNQTCQFSRQNSRVCPNPPRFIPSSCRFQSSLNNSRRFGLWVNERSTRWVCRSTDSEEKPVVDDTGSGSNGSDRRREKQSKDGKWQWRWPELRWQPLVQAQEIGVLLLQLGMMVFVMRLFRPGVSLPGADPKVSTTFVSVPYSEFLSRVNGNEVKKVEVDGVNLMFKLKGGVGNVGDGEVHESESLVKGIAPSKRIVYTTTRPSDIRTPYEKMLENQVEFGSPDKRSGGFLNSALVSKLVELFLSS